MIARVASLNTSDGEMNFRRFLYLSQVIQAICVSNQASHFR
jgi:hypothetical protein